MQVLAVDIGGTKFASGLVDQHGTVEAAGRVPTPVSLDPEALYAELLSLIRPVLAQAADRPTLCSVGSGGPMTAGGATISPLNIPAWRDFPLLARLESDLGMRVLVDNDAKALALGEGWLGAARGSGNYLAMVVSTGVGGGLVVDGRLLDGMSGNAGHIGHVIVVPGGNPCGCGGRGCLEAEISGTGILRRTGIRAEDTGEQGRLRAGNLLGLALAGAVALLDLELVVVGGSVALGFGEPFFQAARASFAEHARVEFARDCRILPVGLGAGSPLIGAGALGWRELGLFDPLRGAPDGVIAAGATSVG